MYRLLKNGSQLSHPVWRAIFWLSLLVQDVLYGVLGIFVPSLQKPRKAGIIHRTRNDRRSERQSANVYPRLSQPATRLRRSYDVVVIGSGYGGSIAASRMARAQPKQSVCVLERGLERWPGEYPSQPFQALASVHVIYHVVLRRWVHSLISLGQRTGLYRLICTPFTRVFVASGLGGGSLLNASVWLRADQGVLSSAAWPKEVRKSGTLDPYYDRAEAMLQPKAYPEDGPELSKYQVLKRQAMCVELAEDCYPVPQMTTFRDKETPAGISMRASSLDGQGSPFGSNDGSKGSTLVTYLSDAWNFGAEIFCGCEVRYIEKHSQRGYLIWYEVIIPRTLLAPWRRKRALRCVHATKLVFLGAGSIGSTEILLRSKQNGLQLSDRVGKGMSGNGSMLTFGYGLSMRTNAVGKISKPHDHTGPTISGIIDARNRVPLDEGFVIQEGVFPIVFVSLFRLVRWLLPSTPPAGRSMFAKLLSIGWRVASRQDVLDYTQVYLTMSHDNANGQVELQHDEPYPDFRDMGRRHLVDRVKEVLIAMTHALGGTFRSEGLKIEVHTLGGASLSANGTGRAGATSHSGEVFSGDSEATHAGLYVVDGSIIPRSLAANPVATICALAERSVEIAANKAGLNIDYDSVRSATDTMKNSNLAASITFAETMCGVLDVKGASAWATLNLDAKVARTSTGYDGRMYGSVECAALSDRPLHIEYGRFKLFEKDRSVPDQSRMVYDCELVDENGAKYVLHGKKILNPSVAFSAHRLWSATTTLATSISDSNGIQIGRGELRITPWAFLRQLLSLRANASSLPSSLRLVLDFGTFFAGHLARHALTPFQPLKYPDEPGIAAEGDETILEVRPARVQVIHASDGVVSTLRMWDARPQPGCEPLGDILLVPGAAVSYLLFAMPTVESNAIDYFTKAGYRCFLLSHRLCKDENASENSTWTAYDARLDVKAALQAIRDDSTTSSRPPYLIAHCIGSLATVAALLDGTISSDWISGLTASAAFMYPLLSKLNQLKARVPLLDLYSWLAGDWFACDSPRSANIVQRLLDQALRLHPVPDRRQLCSSATCHRIQLAFGLLWFHENLSAATHDQLHRIFGGVSVTCLKHLSQMGLGEELTNSEGQSLVNPSNIQRLQQLPILLITGSENRTYRAEGMRRSYDTLRRAMPASRVKLVIQEGLGHLDLWLGHDAVRRKEVFRAIEREIMDT